MKVVVINGTEKKGITVLLKEMFLKPFRENDEVVEFFLPRDCPMIIAILAAMMPQ